MAIIGMDWMYLKSADGAELGDSGATLVMIDYGTSMVRAAMVPSTAVTKYLVEAVVSFIKSLYHGRVQLHSDNEPAIVALGEAVKKQLPEQVILEQTPRYSSGSLGVVERCIKDVQGLSRTLRFAASGAYGLPFGHESPVYPWFPRHAAWTMSRYFIKANRQTPYQMAYGVAYQSEVVPMCETVLFRHSLPSHRRLNQGQKLKGDSMWSKGTWLGRRERNNEHIIGTSAGIIYARTIRRLEPDRRHQPEVVASMKGSPWDPQRHAAKKAVRVSVPVTPQGPGHADGTEIVVALGSQPRVPATPGVQTPVPLSTPGTPRPSAVVGDEDVDMRMSSPIRDASTAELDVGSESKKQRVQRLTVCGAEVELETVDEEIYLGDATLDEVEQEVGHDDLDAGGGGPQTLEEAKQVELDKLLSFNAFEPVVRPSNKEVLPAMWVNVWKGSFWRCRYVCKEFKTVQWWLDDLFAPSSTPVTSRVIDHVALRLRQGTFVIDATNAFLHVPEDDEIYLEPAKEWLDQEIAAGRRGDVVWRALRCWYGRRPSVKKWVRWFAEQLENIGLERCEVAPHFFAERQKQIFLEVHMDDVHGTAPGDTITELFKEIGNLVQIKPEVTKLGEVYWHLKRPRLRTEKGTWVGNNPKYVDDVLGKLGLEQAKVVHTPSTQYKLEDGEETEELPLDEVSVYRSAVGSLLYVAVDREDIQLEVSYLARKLKTPRRSDMHLLKRVARYLAGTRDYKYFLPNVKDPGGFVVIEGYSDSDWAGEKVGRKSQTSGHIRVDGCPMVGWSNRQHVVSLSSAEAEYNAGCSVASMLCLYREIYLFMGFAVRMHLHLDSSAALGMLRREGCGARVRHIAAKLLWVQQLVQKQLLVVHKVKTAENPADLGTKMHGKDRLIQLRELCGLEDQEVRRAIDLMGVQSVRKEVGKVASLSSLASPVVARQLLQILVAGLCVEKGEALRVDFEVQVSEVAVLVIVAVVIVAFILQLLGEMRKASKTELEVKTLEVAVQTEEKRTRAVCVQAQCTYTVHLTRSKFTPLPERATGAWVDE
eukprot:6147173-Amphidinium_carterae.1